MRAKDFYLAVFGFIASISSAENLSGNVTSVHDSYRSLSRFQEFQMNNIQELINKIQTKQLELNKTTPYTVQSGSLQFQLNELTNRLHEQASSFSPGSSRIKMSAAEADEQITIRRNRYFQQVRNLSALPSEEIKAMGLKAEIRSDIEFLRAIRDLPSEKMNAKILQWEWRHFGEAVTEPNQLMGIKREASVRLTW